MKQETLFVGRMHGSVLLALLLTACAGMAPQQPPTASTDRQGYSPQRGRDAVERFEDQQRAQAEAAMQQRRWTDAVWAWDVLLALAPRDAKAREQRNKARVQAEAAAAERRARAQLARQKGDADGATRLYLEALAQWPDDAESANALREMERQRTRRGNVNGYRVPGAVPARRPYPDDGKTTAAVIAGHNELEHASLLASQGDLDAAIAMLQPLSMGRRPDPAVRSRLADFYWRKAEQLAAKDPQAAIGALQRALQQAPGHPKATAKLKELKTASPTPSRPPAR
jgi:tetratricopeptide (TPR) repeat protein